MSRSTRSMTSTRPLIGASTSPTRSTTPSPMTATPWRDPDWPRAAARRKWLRRGQIRPQAARHDLAGVADRPADLGAVVDQVLLRAVGQVTLDDRPVRGE